jgi:hypothetical protein
MTLTELQQEVYTITNRPDLVAQTLTAIRSATLKLHQLDYFYKDIFETGVTFTIAEFEQALDYRLLIPRWRALKYIRKSDVTGIDTYPPFTIIPPENVLDEYNQNRLDVAYVAGAFINIKSSTAFQYMFLGCYIHPDITEAGYSSWIAADHPYAIVFEAASIVFKLIGDTEQFAAYTGLSQIEQNNLKISEIQAVGY